MQSRQTDKNRKTEATQPDKCLMHLDVDLDKRLKHREQVAPGTAGWGLAAFVAADNQAAVADSRAAFAVADIREASAAADIRADSHSREDSRSRAGSHNRAASGSRVGNHNRAGSRIPEAFVADNQADSRNQAAFAADSLEAFAAADSRAAFVVAGVVGAEAERVAAAGLEEIAAERRQASVCWTRA